MSSESVKTKQEELRAKILQSSSLTRLKTGGGTSLAALEKLKADLEAKRQGKTGVGNAAEEAGGTGLASSNSAEHSAKQEASEQSTKLSAPEPQDLGKDKKEKTFQEPPPIPLRNASTTTLLPSKASSGSSISSDVTINDLPSEFEEMMNDLKFTDVQRSQMSVLPESHKQTILLQWKKKKAAMQERRASLVSESPVPSRILGPSPLAGSRVVPSVITTPSPEERPPIVGSGLRTRLGEKDKPSLTVTQATDNNTVILASLEARKQEKMEALRKLKEELAIKRQLMQRGIQKEDLNPEQLQSLMNDLQEQRKQRREAREQKMMAKVEQMKKEGKISSLADMQEAIRLANERRKSRAERALERKERRSTRKLIYNQLEGSGIHLPRKGSFIASPADAALVQETKKLRRLTRHLELETKEIKIDSQLTNFLSSMVKLEEEWKKQEQLRIQRQVEYEMLQKEHQEAQDRLKRSEDLISGTKGRLGSIASALAAAAGRHSGDPALQGCQKELSDLLEHLGMEAISVVDTRTAEQIEQEKKAAIQKRTEELEKEAESEGSLGGLLAQLKGAKLKKVDQEEVERQKKEAPPPPAMGDSMDMFSSLQDTLRGALEMRKLAIMDSDSDSDSDSDFDWDDDDDLDDLDDLEDLMSTTVRL